MQPRVIGLDASRMPADHGEGIFGYGTPDGSLGHNAFLMPAVFADRRRQGVFTYPYSYKWYEVQEPELQWALEKRPGLPLYPGSSSRGMVLIGPAMGTDAAPMSTGKKLLLCVGVVGVVAAILYYTGGE